jgi:carboxyl-terminal processing protease
MKKIFILLITISLLCGIFIGSRLWAKPDTFTILRVFNKILKEIENNYVLEVASDSLIHGAIDGMIGSLNDPHSDYMTKKEYESFMIHTKGEFGGIGATIGERDEKITVISPLEGTPAYRAGLLPGDAIIEVDGVPTAGKGVDIVVREIRGKPGTKVVLTIERTLIDEPFEVEIVRAIIKLDAVPYFGMVDKDIGYVKLANFHRRADVELKDALDSLFSLGAEKIIFDLRLNAGGLLNEGVTVSELFLSKDKEIVATKGRIERERMFRTTRSYSYGEFPMITLVDGGSASASEIVAGALQDWERSLILGTNTFGKGSVQKLFPLEDGGALKLTTDRWYTPSGRSIDKAYDFDKDVYAERRIKKAIISKIRKEIERLEEETSIKSEKELLFRVESELDEMEEEISGVKKDTTESAEKKEFTTLGPLKRKVYGEGAITPDIAIEPPKLSKLETEVLTKGLTFDYVVQYTAAHKDIDEDFEVDEKILKDFAVFLLEKKIEFTEDDFGSVKNSFKKRLKEDIFTNLWGRKEGYRIRITNDPLVDKAIGLLKEVKTQAGLFRFAKN